MTKLEGQIKFKAPVPVGMYKVFGFWIWDFICHLDFDIWVVYHFEIIYWCIFRSNPATIPDEIGHPSGANRPPLAGQVKVTG
jgi:hypothetical protein